MSRFSGFRLLFPGLVCVMVSFCSVGWHAGAAGFFHGGPALPRGGEGAVMGGCSGLFHGVYNIRNLLSLNT